MNWNLPFKEATPSQIKQRLDAGEDLVLIDVREPHELQVAAVADAQPYPMSEAYTWIDQLPKDRELVIMCHHGGRSRQVAAALAQRGYTEITNMSGGIDQWSVEVDPSVPRY